jgi:hypothetical protein
MALIAPSPIVLMFLLSLLMPNQPTQAPPAATAFRYVLSNSQFTASIHLAPLAKDLPQRLNALKQHPLFELFPNADEAHTALVRQIRRIQRNTKRDLERDIFEELKYLTVSMSFDPQRSNPRFLICFGIQATSKDFERQLARRSNRTAKDAHGFRLLLGSSPRSEGLALTPTGEVLVTETETLNQFIQQGASFFQSPALQQQAIAAYKSDQLASAHLLADAHLQGFLKQTAGRITSLFSGWRSLDATLSLHDASLSLKTQDEAYAKRSHLFIQSLKHLAAAGFLSFEGMLHLFNGLVDSPQPLVRSAFVQRLIKHKQALEVFARTYIGQAQTQRIQSQRKGTEVLLTSQKNRAWFLFAIALMSVAIFG